MPYAPQPGTIPHRAVAWLRAMEDLYPGRWYPTPDLCEALDVDTNGFTAYMAPSRAHGLVRTTTKPETGKVLWWRIGNGSPDVVVERDEPIERVRPTVDLSAARAASPFQPLPTFRAMEWDGHLLATGMEIRDGVAIFTPEQVQQLKQKTDWWSPAA